MNVQVCNYNLLAIVYSSFWSYSMEWKAKLSSLRRNRNVDDRVVFCV